MIPLQAPAISYFSAIKMIEDEWSVNQSKKEEVDGLGSVVRIKEAEAQMFQSRADHARGEAVSLRWLAWLESEKLYEVYYEKNLHILLAKNGGKVEEKIGRA